MNQSELRWCGEAALFRRCDNHHFSTFFCPRAQIYWSTPKNLCYCCHFLDTFSQIWKSANSDTSHKMFKSNAEVEFVHPVSHGRSVKFVASGVNFSIFTNFLCFFLLKLLKLGEIGGVKFLTWKSGGVKFWTNSMSVVKMISLDEMNSEKIWFSGMGLNHQIIVGSCDVTPVTHGGRT